MTTPTEALQRRLRDAVTKLRRTPMPIADLVPMLQQAADALAQQAATPLTDDLTVPPPMPEPEMYAGLHPDGGHCWIETGDPSDAAMFAADQLAARDAMWSERVAAAARQAATPAPAESSSDWRLAAAAFLRDEIAQRSHLGWANRGYELETVAEKLEMIASASPYGLDFADPTLAEPPDDSLATEMALSELVDKIAPGLDSGDLLADAAEASRRLDAVAAQAADAANRKRMLCATGGLIAPQRMCASVIVGGRECGNPAGMCVHQREPEGGSGMSADLTVPPPLWALVEQYADLVHDYNQAVRIDVGIDKAGAACLAKEKELRAAIAQQAATDARGMNAIVLAASGPEFSFESVCKAVDSAMLAAPPATPAAQPAEPECVTCTRCGHENWIQEGKAMAQIKPPAAPPSAQAGDALPPTEPRFFIDHGVIHDRLTGLHVHGDVSADAYGVERELAVLNSMARADHLLRELLAVMHSDGGHYAVEHGLQKAKEDAVQVYYALAARGQAGDEREAFEAAMRQTWKMIDPLHPPGQPGSYARGEHNGIAAALRTLRENFDRAPRGAA